MEYIRKFYGVPAKRGGRVRYKGRPGTIVGCRAARLRIQLDGEKRTGIYHPTWQLEYV